MGEILQIHPTRLKTEQAVRRSFTADSRVQLLDSIRSIMQFEESLFEELVPHKPISEVERWLLLHSVVAAERRFSRDPTLEGLPRTEGFIRSVGDLIQQVKLGLVSATDLKGISGFAPGKEEWIKSVFASYERSLHKYGLVDSADIRIKLVKKLGTMKKPPRSIEKFGEIHFYDLFHFTPFRFELIYLIGRFRKVVVNFPLPDDRRKVFDFVESDIQKFQSLEDAEGNIELSFEEETKQQDSDLKSFGGALFDENNPPQLERLPESVEIIRNFSRYREIEEAAERILALKGDGDWSNFCLVFRKLEKYGAIVEDVFRRAGIPLYLRRGIPVRGNPYIRTLLSLFKVIETDYGRDEVVKLVTSQYFSFLPGSVKPHEAEWIFLKAGIINGPPELWKKKTAAIKTKIKNVKGGAAVIRKTLGLLAVIKKLSRAGRAKSCVKAFRDVVKFLSPRDIKFTDPFSLRDSYCRQEFEAIMVEVDSALSSCRLESSPFNWQDLRRLIHNSLADMPAPDWSSRNQVYALNIHDLAGLKFPYVFVCGLHDGEFPLHVEGGSIMTESQKKEFNSLHAEKCLAKVPQRRRGRQVFSRLGESWEEESFLFYVATRSAGQKLFLSYSIYDLNGDELSRSSFLEDIAGSFPNLKEKHTKAVTMSKKYSDQLDQSAIEAKLLKEIFSEPGEDVETLASYFRHVTGRERDRSFILSCEKSRIELERNSFYAEFDPERRARASTPFTGNIGAVDALTDFFDRKVKRTFSPTALERYSECPFRYFMDRVIECKPETMPRPEVERTVQGNVVHKIFELYYRKKKTVYEPSMLPPFGERLKKVKGCAEVVFRKTEKEGINGDEKLWEITKNQVSAMLELFVGQEEELFNSEPFVTVKTELEFGAEKNRVTVEWGGETVMLKGFIDRVDYLPRTGLLRVIDYKYSARLEKFSPLLKPRKFCLESFQVPIYVYAALISGMKEGPVPRGGYGAYYAVKKEPKLSKKNKDISPFEVADSRQKLDVVAASEEFGGRIVGQVLRMESGDFSVTPRDCIFCKYRPVCRYQEVRKVDLGEE